jgi:hypothetical protein
MAFLQLFWVALLDKNSQTLAWRVGLIQLLPFSLQELQASNISDFESG